jgi:hypothetical protein
MRGDDDEAEDPGEGEQDLLVVLQLSNSQMGTSAERQDIEQLADELAAAVAAAGAGEYDGDELGGGECTLFFCGPDPDRLLAVLRPLLKLSPFRRGAQTVRMVAGTDGRMAPRRSPL